MRAHCTMHFSSQRFLAGLRGNRITRDWLRGNLHDGAGRAVPWITIVNSSRACHCRYRNHFGSETAEGSGDGLPES